MLHPAARDSSVTSILLRLPGGEIKSPWSMAWRKKKRECFVCDSALPAHSPGPTHPRAAALCPSPGSCCVQLPLLPLSPGSLWMVGQISALPHQCALGLWSRCCLALAGRILMKSCIRGISLEVFSFCSQSFLCCRILRLPPSKFNVNYLFLI